MDAPPPRSDWIALRQYCLGEALRVLRNRDDAEEAAQEALLRAWRHRRSRRSAAWVPWVRTIARNEAFRVAARPSRQARREVRDSGETGEREAVSEIDGVVDALSMGQLLRPLRQEERDLLR